MDALIGLHTGHSVYDLPARKPTLLAFEFLPRPVGQGNSCTGSVTDAVLLRGKKKKEGKKRRSAAFFSTIPLQKSTPSRLRAQPKTLRSSGTALRYAKSVGPRDECRRNWQSRCTSISPFPVVIFGGLHVRKWLCYQSIPEKAKGQKTPLVLGPKVQSKVRARHMPLFARKWPRQKGIKSRNSGGELLLSLIPSFSANYQKKHGPDVKDLVQGFHPGARFARDQ